MNNFPLKNLQIIRMAEEKNDSRFYVYALYVEGDDAPFYIGKGSGNRLNEHTMPSRMKMAATTIRVYTIRKALRDGKKIIAKKLVENLSESDAFLCEAKCIEQYGRRDSGTGCLSNHSDGGEGGSSGNTKPKSEAHRAAISAALKGRKKTAEHKERLSSSLVGHVRSEESRRKQAETMRLSGAVHRLNTAKTDLKD